MVNGIKTKRGNKRKVRRDVSKTVKAIIHEAELDIIGNKEKQKTQNNW